MPFNIGPLELFIVLVIVLVLFGAKRVPEIGASIGKGIREFKRSISDTERAIREPERDAPPAERLPPAGVEQSARRPEDESRPEPKRLLN
ncbi:MAG: twin-arginine translocase TatA/TatE family subunit [Gemmatimonadota bacterium]|nr:twin-arginine translocase TatA/TatE family subunit [Gemmatimonadota bacterium]